MPGTAASVSQASCVPRLDSAGVEVHCLGARGGRDILSTTLELRRLLASQRPDLVQTFLFHANVLGRIAARLAGVPWVVCGVRVAERQSRWHLWLDRLTAGMVDCYVCVSNAVARFSHVRGGLPSGKLVVIPNGIDVRAYPAPRPADLGRWGIGPERRTIAFVGRLDRQKGVRWLVETCPRWLGRLPDCDLLLVGSGPEEAEVRRLCEGLGIAGRVHLAGWQREVASILAASHLLVLPSRWEGMPNVVLQAMASRLPVLATDAEGVRELLGEAADAQTVRFGRSQELADKLVGLMSDRAAAAELGRANRHRAETCFSIDEMVAGYQEVWLARRLRVSGNRGPMTGVTVRYGQRGREKCKMQNAKCKVQDGRKSRFALCILHFDLLAIPPSPTHR